MMIECLKEGVSLANKNFQLVFLRIAVTTICFLSLLVFLGFSIIAAAVYLGYDISHAEDLLPHLIKNPLEFVPRYIGLVFLMASSIIFYLIFVSMIMLYSLAGALGVLKNSAVNIRYKFSLPSFFREANSNFYRLLRLVNVALLVCIALLFVLIAAGGIIAAAVHGFSGRTPLKVFFSSLVLMSLIIFSAIIFLACIMFMVYSAVVSVIEGNGVMDSIKKTFNFLKMKPQAFLFYLLLFFMFIALNVLFIIIEIPFGTLAAAPLLTIMLLLVNAVFQNYLALILWSSLIVYYIKATNHPVYSATYEI